MKADSSAKFANGPRSTKPLFPFLDLNAQYVLIRDEVRQAIERVMESQQFILGPEVSAFEEDARRYLGCQYAIGCASGSDALLLALMALEIGAGDEVIAPPFTFVSTAACIARLGARAVFVDINPQTFNLDPWQLEDVITRKTKAIIPVHLFGAPAEMDGILEVARAHRVAVIEDAAQAIGAQHKGRAVGSMGTIGCFSFFPSKNLGGAGDGGLLTTNDPLLADRLKILRVHGSRSKYEYAMLGVNSRLDALQAAILRVKLRHLDGWTARRQQNAQRYRELFAEYGLEGILTAPVTPSECVHVYNQFTIRTRDRDGLRAHLRNMGIPSEIYYPAPLHLQPAFADLGYRPGAFPEAEAACAQVLSLPIFPELTCAQLRTVVKVIAGVLAGSRIPSGSGQSRGQRTLRPTKSSRLRHQQVTN
jgi:dTDP-4-amino-4,6-dideoxygalactose transaminase